MEFSDFLTGYVCEGSFLFDGLIFGFGLQGDLFFKLNYTEFRISSGGFFVVLPHRLFSVVSCSPDLELKIFLLSTDFILSLPVPPDFQMLKKADVCPCLQLDDLVSEDIKALCKMIKRYNEGISVGLVKNALMHSIIFMVSSSYERIEHAEVQTYSRPEVLTRRFFDLLLQYYQTERASSFYADRLCVTAKYLSTVIKQTTGYPLLSWVYDVVVLAAKRYLKTTSLTIQQVSEALNFSTPSSFVRFFRQRTGYTPLEYRNKV